MVESNLVQSKTLSEFDKLVNDDDKCLLLNGYLEKSKKWLEAIGRRGANGRWIRNLLAYRPQHKELQERSASPRVRFFLAYSNVKAMAPEIMSKWPTMQAAPKQDDDRKYSDQVQARLTGIVEESDFDRVGQDCVIRGITTESAIISFEKEVDSATGVASGKFYNRDIFTWRPAPGFTGTGMDIVAGDALFIGFETPLNAEIVKTRWNVEFASNDDIKDCSTPGMLGMVDDSCSNVLFKEFYWLSGGKLRGVWFGRLKDTDGSGTSRWAIVRDFEVDQTTKNGKAHIPAWRYSNDLDESTGFGTGDPELVANNQREIENMYSNACVVVKRHALPLTFLDEATYKGQEESIARRMLSGLPLVRRNPSSIQVEQPPTFNQGILPLSESLRDISNTNSGIFDSMAGDQKFAGMPMGTTLALQEAAKARVRLKLDTDVSRWQKEIGRYLLKMLRDNDPQISNPMSLQSKSGGAIEYDPQAVNGAGPFDVSIVVGAGLPKGRLASEVRARELKTEGLYTPLEAIDHLVDDDTERLKADYMQWNNLQQHVEMMQAEADAEKEFQKILGQMLALMNNPEYVQTGVLNTADEARRKMLLDDAWELLDQFPALIKQDEFTLLPGPLQEELLLKFYNPPAPTAPPQIQQPTGVQEAAV